MSQGNSFIKNTGLYFLGNSLSKVVVFLMLPIYSKFILPEDFGYFDLAQASISLAIPIISGEIYIGILRFVKEKNNNSDVGFIVFNGLAYLAVFFAIIFILLWFPNLYSDIEYLTYIIAMTTLILLQNYYVNICRALDYNKLFVITGIISSFVVASSNYILIMFFKFGIESLFISTIIALLYQILHIELVVKIRQYIAFKFFDFNILKKLLFFSFPLSAGSIMYFFLNYYNRLIIENEIGLAGNGYFAIAGKFGLILMFLTSAFTMAWQDYSFTGALSNDKIKTFSTGIQSYNKFLIHAGVILIFVIHFGFDLLIDKQYSSAYQIVSLSIGVNILAASGNFISQTFLALKKPKILLYSSLMVTLLNVAIVGVSVQMFGINGVNVSLMICYFINIMIRMIFLDKKFQFDVNYLQFIFLTLYFLLACLVYSTNDYYYNAIGLIISVFIAIYFFKGEIRLVSQQAKLFFVRA